MITMVIAAASGIVFIATVVGDVTIGAAVAGVFSVLNTLIGGLLLRDVRRTQAGVRHTHKVLTAPRRAVYDNEGRVIGTVLRLETDEDWAGRILPPQRIEDYEEPTS